MQYIVLFSHLTVQLPSVVLSQKHELAVWRPAPFFCIITHVTKNKTDILSTALYFYYANFYTEQYINKNYDYKDETGNFDNAHK